MIRRLGLCLAAVALVSCRDYHFKPAISDQDGLVPPDQFARYGHDQAEAIAIGREFGRTGRADSAVAYAKSLGDVEDVVADTQGFRLTVRFKSGWRTGIAPINDGKRGRDTPGVGRTPAKS